MARPRRARAGAATLARARLPVLPSPAGLPGSYTVPRDAPGAMAVAELLVRHGAASPRDWDTATGSAPELIENAIERHVDHLNRGIADGWSVSAFVRPWSQFLAGMELDPAPD